ncbi:DsbA family oxidoreductase [Companilactobacillus suantsaicola]|uniref:DsbA family oxidoreductase n=1 Tax=Companilactobacillus suantsaicola TaxID=2487723 RepID=A0A4Z0JJW0_9LACO|nr:DsbA family oxidoreductase [Companilactobacillus suantsaicola]TGD22355.1 DsbA family oxidoreductase [Companilactobacillus suantsaicola]
MEIKYWSDIACPFCYIGSTRMKKALKELSLYDDTPLEFKSFQLDPTLPTTTDKTMLENFSSGHGMTTEQATAQIEQISKMGASDGLKVDLLNAVPTNTLDAHRLIKLADSLGDRDLTEKVIDAFYQVYFSKGESIADHDVLKKAATAAGLDAEKIDEVLNSKQFEKEVRTDQMEAQQLGIQGAPFFVIDNKYGISGAQPYETFVQALQQVQAKEG